VVGKKQEPEPDLRDEEGLREGEQMRDEPARLTARTAAAQVTPRTRKATVWCAVSIGGQRYREKAT